MDKSKLIEQLGIVEVNRFGCPVCGKEYSDIDDAIECASRGSETPIAKVGDIVVRKNWEKYPRFGWFDGDNDWIAYSRDNEKAGIITAGNNPFSYSFFYVVTHVCPQGASAISDRHKLEYHVATLAMTGKQGYMGGWTTQKDHYALALATNEGLEVPQSVIADSTTMVGRKFENLL